MFDVDTILFPTDFSECAQHAFPLACALARECGARVVVLHVMLPPVSGAITEERHHPDEYFAGSWDALHKMHAPHDNVRVEHRLEEGHPAKVICEVAEEEGAKLIVLSTHGRTGLRRVLMGSVAEHVVRDAPCPVVTLKGHIARKSPK